MLRLSAIIIVFYLVLMTGCAPAKSARAVHNVSYDKQKDLTVYTMYPYGSVSIPGQWRNDGYSKDVKAQYFSKEGATVYVSFTQCTNFEFNHDGKKKGKEFITAYHDWEFDYRKNDAGLQATLLERDTINNFFIWKLAPRRKSEGKVAYFIFGEKNCKVKRCSVQAPKWMEQEKINFLKQMYLN